MNEFKQIQELLTKKLQELEQLKVKAERSLKKSPEGSLILSSSNGSIQYYHKTSCNQKKGKYIEKSNHKLLKALAQKDYDQHFLKELDKQKNQIEKMLKNIPCIELKDIAAKLPNARKELVLPHVLPNEEYIERWLNVKYTGKNYADNIPMIVTDNGEKVRSKSEKMIADKLYSMGIPYRYEYPLRLKTYGIVYPDFTLLNISTRQEIYFEHFGMMDDEEYCQKAILKIREYEKNGIYLGERLIVSFETLQVPLDMNALGKRIKEIMR